MSLGGGERDRLYDEAMAAVAARDHRRAAELLLELAERAYAASREVTPGEAQSLLADARKALAIRGQLVGAQQRGAQDTQDDVSDGKSRSPVRVAGEGPASQWELTERPKDRLADVAGLDEVKRQIDDLAIKPFLHPEVYERYQRDVSGGILMFGPPGNGKTFIARALAGEIGAAFFVADPSAIRNEYVGRTEKAVKELFDHARQYDRAVLFIDEADGLLVQHPNQPVKAVQQFNMELDGIVKHRSKILTLLATNKPWLITDSVLRPPRVSSRVYVGLPDAAAREEILRLKLRKVPVAEDLDLAQIAALTDGYSGADVSSIVEKAKQSAINRHIAAKMEQLVTTDDLKQAVNEVFPSTDPVQFRRLEKWAQGSDR
jgi:SpoVK/Ycf46/Vps4 family AAA+-type ATPase